MMKIILTIFFPFFLFANNSQIIINNNSNYYDNFNITYIKDNTNKFTIKDIQTKDFNKNISNKFSFGHMKNTLWLKIDILNKSSKRSFILNLNENLYEVANLYYVDKEKLIKKENGLNFFINQREIKRKEIAFNVKVDFNEEKTFYLELRSTLAYVAYISLAKKEYYVQNEFLTSDNFIVYAVGILSFIIIFNLFLFINLREKIYLYYVLYVICATIIVLNSSGFFIFFDLNSITYEMQVFSAVALIFFTLFSIEYFDTKKNYPKINILLKYLYLFFIPVALLSFFYSSPWVFIKNLYIGINLQVLLITSIYIYVTQDRKLKYYIFALILYVIFISFTQFMVIGLIEYNFFNRYSFIIAIIVENIIFSLMLANRYNQLKNEAMQSQNKLLELKNNNEKYLKKEVFNQTIKLKNLATEKEVLLKEVVHRVKNNFHTIIGAIWLESRKENINKENFIELINKIQSMSQIHDFLYNTQDITNIKSSKYIELLVKNIILAYDNKNINYQLNIKDTIFLELEHTISLGIIINEIITNIIKHNPDIKIPNIDIFLENINNKITLIIKSNGSKFDTSSNKKGLGLKLIKDFSKNLPNCTYTYYFNTKANFELSFNKDN